MIVAEALRKDLQGQVRLLEKDLVEQVGTTGPIYSKLRAEYDAAFELKRTAATWTVWRDERITQAAVAWILGTVFVRFCEDNGLFGRSCFLAGPTKERAIWAEESQEEYFRVNPAENDRHWLLTAFDHIGRTQAGKTLFDPQHNAAYHLPVSPDAAKDLIAFWRRTNAEGVLIHDFTDAEWGTRFLGDLYQNLSEATRKTYALLQTPEFVEEFILDLTLTPAVGEFGLDAVKMIDPACGSGHFVLGAFHRLVEQWRDTTTRDAHEIVKLALEAVHGVDINPFAVAIARFRLLIAALREAGFVAFDEVTQVAFPLNLAIGDSLIRVRQLTLTGATDVEKMAAFKYLVEDLDEHPEILRDGRYHVVVGNPPYIAPKDKRLAKLYGETYPDVCSGSFALSVPFAQLLFELSRRPDSDGRGSGYVGQITANSFMKREFGEALVKKFLARRVDLTHVIDTSGAFIPGHGTPTIILVGRSRPARLEATVRTVRSVRGEPGEPSNARDGFVWKAIEEQYNRPGSRSAWVSVDDLERARYFGRFPWILQDGGLELVEELESRRAKRLSAVAKRVGFYGDTHADDVFTLPTRGPLAKAVDDLRGKISYRGDHVRDWSRTGQDFVVFPYTEDKELLDYDQIGSSLLRYLWPFRWELWCRSAGNGTYLQRGRKWWQWHQLPRDLGLSRDAIAFAFVTTHNHFILGRPEEVFNRSAPIVRLSESATVEEHLQLLGILNSSAACFWLKQVSHDKGIRGEGGGFTPDDWERFYEFTGTKLQELPLPPAYPLGLATALEESARRLTALSPAEIAKEAVPTRERLAEAREEWLGIRGRMIALQEELDWEVYRLYGLLDEALTCDDVPEIELGERAFEIVLARKMAAGEAETHWFARHGSKSITQLPERWSPAYRAIVEKRIHVIETNRYLALIERPECKRRWGPEGWDKMQEHALRDWLLDKCEQRELWFEFDENGFEQPRPLSTAQLADELRRDTDFVSVAEIYAPGVDLAKVVADLVDTEHVPCLAALRYKDSGLAKRADWEDVWDLQRKEDAAEDEEAKQRIRKMIPLLPKYAPADFRKPSYWSNRGKLDVPKERFISYPLAGRDGDSSMLIGWGGWNHLQQTHALSLLVVQRGDHDGWPADRLTPLLAGLREILPWVRQWHDEIDPLTGDLPADEYEGFLVERLARWHLTVEDLAGWRPPAAVRGRRNTRG
ncbi:BREX-2 system adenine-specific DNA-methyltransferase PglX [Micromonospora purpureochromogenes]|uniref:BREX-2 system adenine-specific DNA-methyltransferase PglX n=1 Tax=Micromonospora purpureochromogenes TaxID=47872 RepID=UPI000B5B07C9|nr:BREX-2 system adenine-specific DNA-methyltransferase PglX [Micromonospora purpureochromogenes]